MKQHYIIRLHSIYLSLPLQPKVRCG